MSWKSFACMAALGAMASTAAAVPSIGIVDNLDGTGSIEITTTVDGALGAELTLELTGATLTGATPNTALFDDANPGDNPFIAGSPIGGDTTGLGLDLANNRLFASYGSGPLGIGTFTFLDFTYTGTGTGDAGGVVAQGGLLGADLSASSPLGNVVEPLRADFNESGGVNLVDLGILGQFFGQSGQTKATGDASGDGNVDLVDLGILGQEFDPSSPSTAIPEPTTAALALLGVAGLLRRRV